MQKANVFRVLREIVAALNPGVLTSVTLKNLQSVTLVTSLVCCFLSGPGEQQTTKTEHMENVSLVPTASQTLFVL